MDTSFENMGYDKVSMVSENRKKPQKETPQSIIGGLVNSLSFSVSYKSEIINYEAINTLGNTGKLYYYGGEK